MEISRNAKVQQRIAQGEKSYPRIVVVMVIDDPSPYAIER